jgi:hypothetical protein
MDMVLSRTPTSPSTATPVSYTDRTDPRQPRPRHGQRAAQQDPYGEERVTRARRAPHPPTAQQAYRGQTEMDSGWAVRAVPQNEPRARPRDGGQSRPPPQGAQRRQAMLAYEDAGSGDENSDGGREGPMRFSSPRRLEGRILERPTRNW